MTADAGTPRFNFKSKVRHAVRDTPRTAGAAVVDRPWWRP
jgi:hypothetical protein